MHNAQIMFRTIGMVERGTGEGKKLGYPTANLEHLTPPIDLPAGIYAVKVKVEPFGLKDNPSHFGALVIGARKNTENLVEVYILKWNKEIYGKQIMLEVHKKISGIIKFENTKDLLEKIKNDIEEVKKIFGICFPE